MMLGAVLVMAGTSCSDNDEYDNPSRPVEPVIPTSVRNRLKKVLPSLMPQP